MSMLKKVLSLDRNIKCILNSDKLKITQEGFINGENVNKYKKFFIPDVRMRHIKFDLLSASEKIVSIDNTSEEVIHRCIYKDASSDRTLIRLYPGFDALFHVFHFKYCNKAGYYLSDHFRLFFVYGVDDYYKLIDNLTISSSSLTKDFVNSEIRSIVNFSYNSLEKYVLNYNAETQTLEISTEERDFDEFN